MERKAGECLRRGQAQHILIVACERAPQQPTWGGCGGGGGGGGTFLF